jgi:class 3 adenylate cyclase
MLNTAAAEGGTNLKFGGDALLLLFTGEDHAQRAVRAAMRMQTVNRRQASVRLERERIRLKMSIGLHSGLFWSCVAGLPALRCNISSSAMTPARSRERKLPRERAKS